MKRNEIKWGVVLSYTLIFLNSIYGFFLTPYILEQIGEISYGIYKTISAFTGSLMVLDLGLGGTMMRYIAKYRTLKENEKISNFIAMGMIQTSCICFVITIITCILYFFIDEIYTTSLNLVELKKAKQLYVFLSLGIIVHVIENLINGIITGYNKFIFSNGIKVIRLVIRILAVIIFLNIFKDSLVLVLIDLFLTIIFIFFELSFLFIKIKIKIKFLYWDSRIFIESFKYTILMFLTSIVGQINNNVDNIIIGAISGPTSVAVYSMGLLIFGMYENLSTAISGVMLPTVTSLIEEDNTGNKIKKFIIKIGRIQFMILGATVIGFICIGKNFINIWLGDKYEDVYWITLILIIPSLFELCVNVCLSILRAKNKLEFRTGVLFFSTILNVIVSIMAVKYWSYIGAAFGTAISFIIGSVIIMNIYYYKVLHLPMIYIYKEIMRGTWLCLIISGGVLYWSNKYLEGNWPMIIGNIIIFCIIYGMTLFIFGLTEEEKRQILLLNKFRK